jgi:hypothetical protein
MRILFKGIKQETKQQKHKRLQKEFLDNYNKYQLSKKKKLSKQNEDSKVLNQLRKMLGL